MKLDVRAANFIQKIPKASGVYRFYDEAQVLLYVGKALNLNNRVKSYFQKSVTKSPRIVLMVSKIRYIEVTVTENEASALILENNLIKSLKPKYNIVFRDDKSYPLIRISDHQYPRIDSYRGKINQKHKVFGPYTNAFSVKQTLDMIQRIFKIRTCSDTFFSNRTRPCILYQIKRCTAPCVGYITEDEYAKSIALVTDFLTGSFTGIISQLTKAMNSAADKMDFELAATIRDEIELVRQVSASQIISDHNKPITADILAWRILGKKLFVYIIMLRSGLYVGDAHYVLDLSEADDILETQQTFIEGYYNTERNTKKIFTMVQFDEEFKILLSKGLNITISNNIVGRIDKLYKMAEGNLEEIITKVYQGNDLTLAANELATLLGIDKIDRIECIDVSHNHGSDAVASLVVYENGIIDHSKYRKYNLPSNYTGDDIFAMKSVIQRRLANQDMLQPQVILVDGGINQYKAIKNILTSVGLCGKIRVVAIFKGERRNPKFDQAIISDETIISASAKPLIFKLLQYLRDEAHRFAITGHRKKQIKGLTRSVLTEIPNVGAEKKRALIAYFGGIEKIAKASVTELQKVAGIGQAVANQIYWYFH